MALLNIALLLIVGSNLVMGYAIDSRNKRQISLGADFFAGLSGTSSSSLDSSLSSGSNMGGGINEQTGVSNLTGGITDGFSEVAAGMASNAQIAFNNTYQEEKNSVSDSWNSMKDLAHQNVETVANLTKTGFDLGTIFPKFGKNLVIGH